MILCKFNYRMYHTSWCHCYSLSTMHSLQRMVEPTRAKRKYLYDLSTSITHLIHIYIYIICIRSVYTLYMYSLISLIIFDSALDSVISSVDTTSLCTKTSVSLLSHPGSKASSYPPTNNRKFYQYNNAHDIIMVNSLGAPYFAGQHIETFV